MIISSLSGLLNTRQTVMNGFGLVLFLYLSILSCTTVVGNTTTTESTEFYKHIHGHHPTEDFTYMGCFSKKNLNWIATNTNYELTFVMDPQFTSDLSSICKGYFHQFGSSGVNVVALQHQMLLCINLPTAQPGQGFRFLRVNESECSLRTSSASGGTVSAGGTNAIALYCETPGNCLQNYVIVDGPNYYINADRNSQYIPVSVSRNTDTLPIQFVETSYSHPSSTPNYTTRYYDWNKDHLTISYCSYSGHEYRTPKQEALALLSFWNAYVPHADQKPYMCVKYCNDPYNYITESRDGQIPKYAVLSHSNKSSAFFGLCHCTDTPNGFYAMTIKLCHICKVANLTHIIANCTSHDFTTHRVYCNDRNEGKSCKTEEPKVFISCKESSKCYAKDPYGSIWSACPGVTVQRPCPDPPSKNGTAFWVCQSNGQFQGVQPDYDNCTSDQLYNIENISRRTDFGSTSMKAKTVLSKLKDLVIPKGPQPIGRITTNYFGHDISKINNIVNNQSDEGLSSMIDPHEREDFVTDAVKVTANLIAVKDPWNQLNSEKRSQTATDCISSVEKNLFTFAEMNNMAGSMKPLDLFPIDKDSDGFRVTLGDAKEHNIIFPSDAETSFITVTQNTRFPQQDSHYVGIQMKSIYMDPLISPDSNSPGKNPIGMNSKAFNGNIISLTFSNATVGQLASKNGVEIKISHNLLAVGATRKEFRRKLHPGEQRKAVLGETVCAYWDTKLLLWSTDGCQKITNRSNSQETVCKCDHLTAFAILTDMHGYIGKDKGLEILTLILCSLSIFCLIATIVILTKMKVLHGERSTITKHLCVNLILGNLLLLLLVDRNYFFLSDISCTLVGIMTHYVFLSAFGWMAVQGLYLHRMVVKIFDTGKSYMLVYTIGAYSYPLFPIALTAGIGYGVKDHPYGGEMFCWLNGDYIWAFLGPVAIILIGNFIVMVRTMRTVHDFQTSDLRTKSAQIRANRKWVKGCLALSVLLGLTWITGFFTLLDTPTFFFMSYVFTVLNASQGIFILIFFCLLHEKVQPLMLKKLDLLKSSFTKTSNATDSRSSAVSKQTSSTRVPDTRSQENETSFRTETDEANYDRASASVLFSNESNVHKDSSSDEEDDLDDEQIEMGLQEIPPPPYSTSEESEDNEDAKMHAINSPSPTSHNKVLQYYDEATRRESISSESEENESDVLGGDGWKSGDPTSEERRRRAILGPPWIDEMVESKLFIKRSKN